MTGRATQRAAWATLLECSEVSPDRPLSDFEPSSQYPYHLSPTYLVVEVERPGSQGSEYLTSSNPLLDSGYLQPVEPGAMQPVIAYRRR